jgi:ferric-dicitrate binding protein FerR (iron transport regulator)
MSEKWEPQTPDRSEDRDPIARVLKAAGSRPQPDPDKKAAFEQTLHSEWRRATAPRRHRQVVWWAAAAAGVAAVLLLGWLRPYGIGRGTVASDVVGHVVRTEGAVRSSLTANASVSRDVIDGAQIRTDNVLETTSTGRVALAFGTGTSVRLDRDTRVVVVAERSLVLERGAIYVDADSQKAGPVAILTTHGEVRDIGTQFQVRVEGAAMRVMVREGEVLINGARSQMTARAGEALFVAGNGLAERSTISRYAPEWGWASQVAPRFDLEGSTVQRFLDWVAREKGWRWRFVDDDTSRRAADIVAHGSIEGYTPEEALDIVLPTCGLSYVREGDEVVVSFIKEPTPRGR